MITYKLRGEWHSNERDLNRLVRSLRERGKEVLDGIRFEGALVHGGQDILTLLDVAGALGVHEVILPVRSSTPSSVKKAIARCEIYRINARWSDGQPVSGSTSAVSPAAEKREAPVHDGRGAGARNGGPREG